MSTTIKGSVKITTYNNTTIRLLDLTNAGLRGKECIELTIYISSVGREGASLFTDIKHNMDSKSEGRYPLEKVTDWQSASMFYEIAEALYSDNPDVQFYTRTTKAIRVFPVHDLKRIKPIKKRPSKWRVSDVIRLLVNKQYTDLKCNGKYTDDYHYDNAYDFQRGKIADPIAFAQDLYENPDGWWVNNRELEKGTISINCHSFDYNELKPMIKEQN